MASKDPLSIIGEILGEPASRMRNPVNADYQCPFINSTCIKRSQKIAGPYPVCSIFAGPRHDNRLMCICPKRFFQAEIQRDVLEHVWVGEKPKNPRIAYEVQMKGFGNVDFVVADVDPDTNIIGQFVSVELQAVDCSGSVEPAYQAVLNSQTLARRPSYGFNWSNVEKRFITQLVKKGFFHHHWGTRIVSAIQVPVYEYFHRQLNFSEIPIASPQCNVVFMLYDFVSVSEDGEVRHKLQLARTVGATHMELMNGVLYRLAPDRAKFCSKIQERLQ